MDKAEQPTITQADIEAAEQWRFIECMRCSEYEGDFVHDLAADFARHRIAGQSASCDLGIGCDEAGVCYAMANGKPEMCPRTTSLAAQDGLVEAFYIDCEFDGHNGSLLSIALVGDTDSIHIKTTAPARDDWVLQNVLPLMDMHNAPKSASVSLNDVGSVIRAFLGDCKCPVIIADSPVDIGRFCRALSTSTDGQWASTDFPAMRFEVHNVDCYPTTLEGAFQHNAWWDAMALKAALSAIKEQHHD